MSEERAPYNTTDKPQQDRERVTRRLIFADGSELVIQVIAPGNGSAWGLAGDAYYRRIYPVIETIGSE